MTSLKIIVLCLALANVGYFLWSQGIANSEEAPVPAARTLRLASEAAPAGPPPSGLAAPAAPVTASDPGTAFGAAIPNPIPQGLLPHSGQRCVTVGPFHDVAEAARAAGLLRRGGYDPRQRVIEGEVWSGLWVYVPLPAGRPAADQSLAKLKAAGIDDALEMPGPEDGSVLSLGLFGDQKRAQARVSQAQAAGLNPALVDRKRTGNLYWVDVDLKPTDGALNPADLQGDAGRISRVEVKACQASAAQP